MIRFAVLAKARSSQVNSQMAYKDGSTTRIRFSRLATVLGVLFAFVLFSFPQLGVGVTGSVPHEAEAPTEEDEKTSEEELSVTSLGRRRVYNPRLQIIRPRKGRNHSQQICLAYNRQPAIAGHRLSNGLRAPLLI